MRRILPSIFAILLVTCIFNGCISLGPCISLDKADEINNRKNATAQNASEIEEYEVYDALIGDEKGPLVISADTTLSGAENHRINYSELQEIMPTLEEGTFEDFEAKNRMSYSLKNLFSLKSKYVIINNSEIYEVYPVNPEDENNGWKKYYEWCTRPSGIFYFSRVGLNSQKDQALLEIGFSFPHALAGHGNLVLLEKRSGLWNVSSSLPTWVS